MNPVVDNAAAHRFELPVEDDLAVAYYRNEGDRIILTHTEVPRQLSGRGIGSRLAHGVFETLRATGCKVEARCPFMADFVRRHPEYADLLVV